MVDVVGELEVDLVAAGDEGTEPGSVALQEWHETTEHGAAVRYEGDGAGHQDLRVGVVVAKWERHPGLVDPVAVRPDHTDPRLVGGTFELFLQPLALRRAHLSEAADGDHGD